MSGSRFRCRPFSAGFAPDELLENGRSEVQGYGGELLDTVVTGADRVDGSIRLTTQTGRVIEARRQLVTTGLTDELPAVAGLQGRVGSRRPALPVPPRLGGA